jgi:hypothetical protein
VKAALRRMPSASMLVAITALIVAASGTAIAASGLVSGDGLIKRNSLSGDRVRNHTISGIQVNMSKLGKVPSAKKADRAFVAGSSENAVHAQDAARATSAKNADALGGQPASAFDSAANFARSGLVGAGAGQTVPLASFGPFTLTLRCTGVGGGGFTAEIQAASSEANSEAHGILVPPPGSAVTIVTQGPRTTFAASDDAVAFLTPSGKAFAGEVTTAVNYPSSSGQPCLATALVSRS